MTQTTAPLATDAADKAASRFMTGLGIITFGTVAVMISGWGIVTTLDQPDLDTLPALGNGTHTIGSFDAPRQTWIAPGGPRCKRAAYAGIGDGQPMAAGQGAGRQVANLDDDAQLLRTEQCGTWTIASLTPASPTPR